jgi:hypothetical protein
LKTFGPRAAKLGWQRAAGDSDERHDLRRAFVGAVARRDPVLGKQAEQLADTWLAKKTGIDDELVGSVLATAAYRGNAARFDQIVAALPKARDRAELGRLLGTLGGFRDPALATRALELVRDKKYDLRDTSGILFRVLWGRETRKLGFAFVTQHIDELLGRMRDDEAAGFLGGLAGSTCEPAMRTAVADLVVARAEKVDGAKNAVTRGLEQSDQCIAALARQLPALKKFLAKY